MCYLQHNQNKEKTMLSQINPQVHKKRTGRSLTLALGLCWAASSAAAPVDTYYRQIEQHADYNAFISLDRNLPATSAVANGPLSGMVLSVKDNIHVAGLPNTAGTPLLKNFVPAEDAALVKRLKQAGALIIGKNNMHELAYGITSNNAAFGSVHNGVMRGYTAGGSSGGTGAAVALGLVDAGIGTDTGGSVRIPAALNGLVGLRPTMGRYPDSGMTSISNTRDTAGPITRTVADAALLDSVLSGDDSALPAIDIKGLRLGVPRPYFYADLDPQVAAAMDRTLDKLRAAGAVLVEAELAGIPELNAKVSFPIVLYETSQLLPAYFAEHVPGTSKQQIIDSIASPDVKQVVGDALNGAIGEAAYLDARDTQRPLLQQAYADYFKQQAVEAVIFPTTPLPARPLQQDMSAVELNGEQVPTFPTYIRNTDPASNAGIPGISVPAGVSSDGLPIGVELDGPTGSDRRLLAVAAAVEAVLTQE
jgi:indoleacetamide hydrolase